MKKLIFFLSFAIATLTASAQEHLSFKGIPIEGSLTTFCQKLKAKGLVQIHSENNIRWFTGDFTGREATIGVVGDQTGKYVFAVAVIFPASGEWKTLVSTYDYYKDLYTEKYGAPSFKKEYNPSMSDNNTALMVGVDQGTVDYESVFTAPGGTIKLSIDKADGIFQGQVIIRYKDAQNVQQKRQLDLDEI